MRSFYPFFILLILPTIAFAQLQSFNLSSYKQPEILTRQLDFNGYLNGVQGNDFTHSRIDSEFDEWDKGYRHSFIGDADFEYGQYKNSEKYQGSFSASTSTYLARKWQDNIDPTKIVDKTQRFVLNINSQNRWYGKKQRFIEFDVATRPSYTHNNGYSVLENGTDLSLLIGKGRIEHVEDARLAVYILQDLEKNMRLKREPSHEEILELARKISELKKKRFFDQRLRRIEELKSVDSLLTKQGLVHENDIIYYTHLSDNWDYSTGPIRYAGTRVSGGLVTNNSATNYSSRDTLSVRQVFDFLYHDMEFGPSIIAEWHTPINLYWQRTVTISSTYFLPTARELIKGVAIDEAGEELRFWTNFKLSYSYFPNSRTSMGLAGSLDLYTTDDYTSIDSTPISKFGAIPRIGGFFDYYFSPQLTVNASYGFNYLFSKTKIHRYEANFIPGNTVHNINQTLNVSLLYSIF